MYHYTECGLPGIWLGSGVTIENNPEFGELVRIPHVKDLHGVIGRSVIKLPRTLTGDEFRFLRVELDCSHRRLAQKLGTNERSIAKWETAHDKPVANRSAERILRLLFSDHIDGERKLRELIVEMADLIPGSRRASADAEIAALELRIELDEQSGKWKTAA